MKLMFAIGIFLATAGNAAQLDALTSPHQDECDLIDPMDGLEDDLDSIHHRLGTTASHEHDPDNKKIEYCKIKKLMKKKKHAPLPTPDGFSAHTPIENRVVISGSGELREGLRRTRPDELGSNQKPVIIVYDHQLPQIQETSTLTPMRGNRLGHSFDDSRDLD